LCANIHDAIYSDSIQHFFPVVHYFFTLLFTLSVGGKVSFLNYYIRGRLRALKSLRPKYLVEHIPAVVHLSEYGVFAAKVGYSAVLREHSAEAVAVGSFKGVLVHVNVIDVVYEYKARAGAVLVKRPYSLCPDKGRY